MALTRSVDMTSYTNSTTALQPRNMFYTREAKDMAKKIFQGHIIVKLKKKVMSQGTMSPCQGLYNKKVIPAPILMPTAPLVTTSYPYQPKLNGPLALNDWHPMNTPLFTIQPLPVVIPNPSTIFPTHIYPFGGIVLQPIFTPIIPQTFVQDNGTNVANYINEFNYSPDQIHISNGIIEVANDKDTYYMKADTATELEQTNVLNDANGEAQSDPLELYLTLPKELFPTPRTLTVDPNSIIDEFCKIPDIQRHAPWILDLEFGIPKTLVSRPLPIYDVKFNNILCKNTPDAIHPIFESCTPGFKRALLFYYNCIISAWYKGFMMITRDRSVENFQTWLLLPMQVLGMCWP